MTASPVSAHACQIWSRSDGRVEKKGFMIMTLLQVEPRACLRACVCVSACVRARVCASSRVRVFACERVSVCACERV